MTETAPLAAPSTRANAHARDRAAANDLRQNGRSGATSPAPRSHCEHPDRRRHPPRRARVHLSPRPVQGRHRAVELAHRRAVAGRPRLRRRPRPRRPARAGRERRVHPVRLARLDRRRARNTRRRARGARRPLGRDGHARRRRAGHRRGRFRDAPPRRPPPDHRALRTAVAARAGACHRHRHPRSGGCGRHRRLVADLRPARGQAPPPQRPDPLGARRRGRAAGRVDLLLGRRRFRRARG